MAVLTDANSEGSARSSEGAVVREAPATTIRVRKGKRGKVVVNPDLLKTFDRLSQLSWNVSRGSVGNVSPNACSDADETIRTDGTALTKLHNLILKGKSNAVGISGAVRSNLRPLAAQQVGVDSGQLNDDCVSMRGSPTPASHTRVDTHAKKVSIILESSNTRPPLESQPSASPCFGPAHSPSHRSIPDVSFASPMQEPVAASPQVEKCSGTVDKRLQPLESPQTSQHSYREEVDLPDDSKSPASSASPTPSMGFSVGLGWQRLQGLHKDAAARQKLAAEAPRSPVKPAGVIVGCCDSDFSTNLNIPGTPPLLRGGFAPPASGNQALGQPPTSRDLLMSQERTELYMPLGQGVSDRLSNGVHFSPDGSPSPVPGCADSHRLPSYGIEPSAPRSLQGDQPHAAASSLRVATSPPIAAASQHRAAASPAPVPSRPPVPAPSPALEAAALPFTAASQHSAAAQYPGAATHLGLSSPTPAPAPRPPAAAPPPFAAAAPPPHAGSSPPAATSTPSAAALPCAALAAPAAVQTAGAAASTPPPQQSLASSSRLALLSPAQEVRRRRPLVEVPCHAGPPRGSCASSCGAPPPLPDALQVLQGLWIVPSTGQRWQVLRDRAIGADGSVANLALTRHGDVEFTTEGSVWRRRLQALWSNRAVWDGAHVWERQGSGSFELASSTPSRMQEPPRLSRPEEMPREQLRTVANLCSAPLANSFTTPSSMWRASPPPSFEEVPRERSPTVTTVLEAGSVAPSSRPRYASLDSRALCHRTTSPPRVTRSRSLPSFPALQSAPDARSPCFGVQPPFGLTMPRMPMMDLMGTRTVKSERSLADFGAALLPQTVPLLSVHDSRLAARCGVEAYGLYQPSRAFATLGSPFADEMRSCQAVLKDPPVSLAMLGTSATLPPCGSVATLPPGSSLTVGPMASPVLNGVPNVPAFAPPSANSAFVLPVPSLPQVDLRTTVVEHKINSLFGMIGQMQDQLRHGLEEMEAEDRDDFLRPLKNLTPPWSTHLYGSSNLEGTRIPSELTSSHTALPLKVSSSRLSPRTHSAPPRWPSFHQVEPGGVGRVPDSPQISSDRLHLPQERSNGLRGLVHAARSASPPRTPQSQHRGEPPWEFPQPHEGSVGRRPVPWLQGFAMQTDSSPAQSDGGAAPSWLPDRARQCRPTPPINPSSSLEEKLRDEWSRQPPTHTDIAPSWFPEEAGQAHHPPPTLGCAPPMRLYDDGPPYRSHTQPKVVYDRHLWDQPRERGFPVGEESRAMNFEDAGGMCGGWAPLALGQRPNQLAQPFGTPPKLNPSFAWDAACPPVLPTDGGQLICRSHPPSSGQLANLGVADQQRTVRAGSGFQPQDIVIENILPPPVPWERIIPSTGVVTGPAPLSGALNRSIPLRHNPDTMQTVAALRQQMQTPQPPRGRLHDQPLLSPQQAVVPVDVARSSQEVSQEVAWRAGVRKGSGPRSPSPSEKREGLANRVERVILPAGARRGELRSASKNGSVCSDNIWDQLPDTERSYPRSKDATDTSGAPSSSLLALSSTPSGAPRGGDSGREHSKHDRGVVEHQQERRRPKSRRRIEGGGDHGQTSRAQPSGLNHDESREGLVRPPRPSSPSLTRSSSAGTLPIVEGIQSSIPLGGFSRNRRAL